MAFFTEDQIAELSASVVRAPLLLKLDFVSGAKYLWNGNTKIVAGGETYEPLYGLGQISGISFSRQPVSKRFTLSMEAVAAATADTPGSETNVLAIALSETDEVYGRVATVSMLFLDEDWQPVGNPVPLAFGLMRKPRVTRTRIDGGTGPIQRVSVGAENIFYNRALPAAGRFTDRDQQARFSGDLICQFQPLLRAKNFTYPDY